MYNTMNDYFISIKKFTMIIIDDLYLSEKDDIIKLIIFSLSIVISIISLIIMKNLIQNFINERERPINFFLTIKRRKFEDLKLLSDEFLNKLLNNMRGNEENEEENNELSSTFDSNDINLSNCKINIKNIVKIVKEEKKPKLSSEYIIILARTLIFFIIFISYMTFKFLFVNETFYKIKNFIKLYNYTRYSETDLIFTTNLMK